GREGDHACMPCTFCYIVGPVDLEKHEKDLPDTVKYYDTAKEKGIRLSAQAGVVGRFKEALEKGDLRELNVPCALGLSIPGRPSYVSLNFWRVQVKDPTEPRQLAGAEAKGRVQIAEGVAFLKKYFPGFADAELAETGLQIGV